jgi:hypothetical protein
MKVVISSSIDDTVSDALTQFCERVVDGRKYKLSKSEVVNTALKEHITRNGGDVK